MFVFIRETGGLCLCCVCVCVCVCMTNMSILGGSDLSRLEGNNA